MDYLAFKLKLKRQHNLDFTGYRDVQIQRRLNAYMQKNNLPDYSSLLRYLSANHGKITEMRDYLAINVSEFYRNPELFDYLAAEILPEFMGEDTFKIWSAGCSVGYEAYTVGIIAQENLRNLKWSVQATDIDGEALTRAKAAKYSEEEIKMVPELFRGKYFSQTQEGNYILNQSIRSRINFSRLDLLKDPFPLGLDLILCRNVVIYFTEEAKNEIFEKMAKALKPGGVLFIGATEGYHNFRAHKLQKLHPCFYQKIRGGE